MQNKDACTTLLVNALRTLDQQGLENLCFALYERINDTKNINERFLKLTKATSRHNQKQ